MLRLCGLEVVLIHYLIAPVFHRLIGHQNSQHNAVAISTLQSLQPRNPRGYAHDSSAGRVEALTG